MQQMLWCQDGLTWKLTKYPASDWPSWTVANNTTGKSFTSKNLYDCMLWVESRTGKKISLTDIFSG